MDALPGSNAYSKTAILSAGAGLSIAAISNEIYVVNEESIVLLSMLTIFWGVYHYLGPSYSEWADGYANKITGILQTARKDHKDAVQSRINSVKNIGEVVDVTKNLFAVSKVCGRWLAPLLWTSLKRLQETAQLEAQAYELEQKTAVVAEAKAVLDSWVRYEGQQKARQQRELAESIIAKVEKELENPRVLKQILDQSLADVES